MILKRIVNRIFDLYIDGSSYFKISRGEKKASIVNKAINGPVTIDVAASYLQKHADAKYFLDTPAAAEL